MSKPEAVRNSRLVPVLALRFKFKLKMMMQEHEAGVAGSHRITWKSATRTNLDSAKLKAELGDRYDEYTKKTSYRTLAVA